eukprot:758729-Rhodomonas_salina.1
MLCENKIFSIYSPSCDSTTASTVPDSDCANQLMSMFAGNISLEELTHLRMSHTKSEKLVEQSKRVDGMKRVLHSLCWFRGPCHCCQDAKSKQNDYPPGTEIWADGPDRWNFDMFDMGKDFKTIHGNRYTTMIVIHKNSYGMLFLHKDKSAATVKEILQKAFAKAGIKPRIVRSDGAGEYEDEDLNKWLTAIGVHHQYSAVDSQYQNALAEKFLDTLGNGIRAIMLQSNLP